MLSHIRRYFIHVSRLLLLLVGLMIVGAIGMSVTLAAPMVRLDATATAAIQTIEAALNSPSTPIPSATPNTQVTATAQAAQVQTAVVATLTAQSIATATPPPTFTPDKTATAAFATAEALRNTQSWSPMATPIPTPIPPSFDTTELRNPLNDGIARLHGVGQPGCTVQVLVNGTLAGATVVRANRAWGLNVDLGSPGSYRITVRSLNTDGKLIQSIMRSVTVTVLAPTSIPTPTTTMGVVQLVAPSEGEATSGLVIFQWATNFTLAPGLAFELVFWKKDQDPIVNSFGLAAPTKATKVSVDLNALDEKLGNLLDPGYYQWGIILVRVSPYERIQLMGQTRSIRFDRGSSSDSGGASGGGQKSGE